MVCKAVRKLLGLCNKVGLFDMQYLLVFTVLGVL